MPKKSEIVIIGGGASGFFCALRCAELAREKKQAVSITILEATSKFLSKVKISGGGRCNVTHNQFRIRNFCENYPRGQRELRSPFHQFQALDTVEWFHRRGIKLKTESDGRMFPISDSSQTIINCFLKLCEKYQIKLKTKHKVSSIKTFNNENRKESESENQYNFSLRGDNFAKDIYADRLVIATGGIPAGHKLARQVGHTITPLAPSLFTFRIQNLLIKDLSGVSFSHARLKLKTSNKSFQQSGPLLITHWGLSGPALLKLSAWAAREMKVDDYCAKLVVNWIGLEKSHEQEEFISLWKKKFSRTQFQNACPDQLPKRFWMNLISIIEKSQQIDLYQIKVGELPKKILFKIKDALFYSELEVNGKNRFKEEFVECGGVDLKEVDFKTMSSKLVPSLYFCGELLDIDGVTGGFNFQNAWTSGWIAGSHIIESFE